MRIKQEVIDVLRNARTEGNLLYIDAELDRKLYADVAKLLKQMGGKWSSAKHATVFPKPVSEVLQTAIGSGKFTSEKKTFQFFPTPDALAQRCVELAHIREGERCLEPSAGHGNIAKYMPGCDCIELNPDNRSYLQEHGFNLVHDDYMSFAPAEPYDVVVMNPPFANCQDVRHISKALGMARRCVVAIASASVKFGNTREQVEFRKLLDSLQATIEDIPAGAFKESGTNVNSVLIVVNKAD